MARRRSQQTDRDRHGSADHRSCPGTLFIVGTPIGSPDDVTLRALAILRQVPIIAAETPRITQDLLTHHGITATITSYGPRNYEEKIAVLLHYLNEGQDIALVSDSGMPLIYDPGQRLITAAHEKGYPVSVIPGPSVLTAAVALSGYSGDRIVFEGHLPGTGRLLDHFFARCRQETRTMVFFASSRSLSSILRSLARILPARQVTLMIDMTKKSERLYQGTPASLLGQIRSIPPDEEITVVMRGKQQQRIAGKQKRSMQPATRRFDAG